MLGSLGVVREGFPEEAPTELSTGGNLLATVRWRSQCMQRPGGMKRAGNLQNSEC